MECTYDELGLGILFQNPGEDICDQIHTLLQTPATNKHKQLSLGILLEAGPLLSLALELGSASLKCLVNGWLLSGQSLWVPLGIVLRTRLISLCCC